MNSLDLLFLEDTPLIDVRAPVEFKKGAFPSARNLPIITDAEREQIGICYKERGSDAAVELGHRLVSGDTRRARTRAWVEFIERHPDARVYCFRGGQRSRIARDWLKAEGIDITRIEGGYKKLRNHLLCVFDKLPPLVIVGGKTGTGKTTFLESHEGAVDLEGIANHRGSAFGKKVTPQPTQIDFENAVAIEFLRLRDRPHVLLEDEGRLIGKIHLPPALQERMKQSPIILIEESLEARTENIYREYIEEQWQEYRVRYGDRAARAFSDYLLGAMDAIRKRLGNVVHGKIRRLMEAALADNEPEKHRHWIRRLLTDYYDPMYNYQLSGKQERIRFCGTADAAGAWYRENGI